MKNCFIYLFSTGCTIKHFLAQNLYFLVIFSFTPCNEEYNTVVKKMKCTLEQHMLVCEMGGRQLKILKPIQDGKETNMF